MVTRWRPSVPLLSTAIRSPPLYGNPFPSSSRRSVPPHYCHHLRQRSYITIIYRRPHQGRPPQSASRRDRERETWHTPSSAPHDRGHRPPTSRRRLSRGGRRVCVSLCVAAAPNQCPAPQVARLNQCPAPQVARLNQCPAPQVARLRPSTTSRSVLPPSCPLTRSLHGLRPRVAAAARPGRRP
jgi:hypothetical protein